MAKTKYNLKRQQIICDALRNGESRTTAAKRAGIQKDTFYNWLEQFSAFSAAVKEAEDAYQDWLLNGIKDDALKSLKTLICGLDYEETKTEYEQNPNDPSQPRIKKQTVITKKILPNATAVIFALTNRDPERWKNRYEQTIDGRLDTESKTAVSLEKVPDDLLAQVLEAINGK